MNSTLIAFIVILTIAAGMIMKYWQDRRYFYLKTFYYRVGESQNVIQLMKSGHYILNQTVVPDNANHPASFAVDEGTFVKDNGQLVLDQKKGMKLVYHDVKSLVSNENPQVKKAVKSVTPLKLQLIGKEVHYDSQALKPVPRAKVQRIASLKKLQSTSKKQ